MAVQQVAVPQIEHPSIGERKARGKQARDRMKRDVPAFVQDEMRKARNELLDLKVQGNDLAKPIGILKDASGNVKQEAWGDALRQIREFRKAIKRL